MGNKAIVTEQHGLRTTKSGYQRRCKSNVEERGYLTFRENSYLSSSVRVQEDRGQTVVTTGPYRYMRHPMYARGILFFLGTPLLLGSWYEFVMGLVFIVMMAGRAVLEERMLRNELEGHGDYMSRVKCRFIPHIW